ncbi:MAG TPA: hypothetical protein VF403_15445, partial [Kofleriaceae bacterium]
MAVRVRGLLFAAVCLSATTVEASRPRAGSRIAADTLTAMPAANLSKPLRTTTPLVAQAVPPIAWMSLAGHWQATWDPATGVPRQLFGEGIVTPGANADGAIAETAARAMLAAHLDLLAPGASVGDFQLVSNTSDGSMRTVGFQQFASGHRVVGGQISFWFKRDRLFVISSQALPHVTFEAARTRMASTHATAAIRDAVTLPNAPVTANGDDVVLPLVGDSAVLGYRLVSPYTIDGGADGRYLAYVDPSTAGVIAVHQLNDYATGTV